MSQYKTESFYNTERKSIERWMPKNGTIQKGNYAAIQAGNTPQYRRDLLFYKVNLRKKKEKQTNSKFSNA